MGIDEHRPSPRGALEAAMVALVLPPGELPLDQLAEAVRAAPASLLTQLSAHGVDAAAFVAAKPLQQEFPELVRQLNVARQRAWRTHLTRLADLDVVLQAFEQLDAPWAVVKGPVLVERAYPRPDQRDYYDLDVLVHPAAFPRAIQLLVAAGAHVVQRNWELHRRDRRAEVGLMVNGRTPLDLHWHLINARFRDATNWDMAAMLDRVQVVDLAGRSVPVLDDCDSLMHVAEHATKHGGHRLIWHLDVARCLAARPVEYAELEVRARVAGIWPLVHLALLRTSRTFGIDPPPNAPGWSRLAARFGGDRFHSGANGSRSGEVWGRAAQRGTVRNAGTAGYVIVRRRAASFAHRFEAPSRIIGPHSTVEELQRDAGPEAMTAYFAQVMAEVRRPR